LISWKKDSMLCRAGSRGVPLSCTAKRGFQDKKHCRSIETNGKKQSTPIFLGEDLFGKYGSDSESRSLEYKNCAG
jgi:hypothetical protein